MSEILNNCSLLGEVCACSSLQFSKVHRTCRRNISLPCFNTPISILLSGKSRSVKAMTILEWDVGWLNSKSECVAGLLFGVLLVVVWFFYFFFSLLALMYLLLFALFYECQKFIDNIWLHCFYWFYCFYLVSSSELYVTALNLLFSCFACPTVFHWGCILAEK